MSSSLNKHKNTADSLTKRKDFSADQMTQGDKTDDFIKNNYASNTSDDLVKMKPPMPIEIDPLRGVFATITNNSTRYMSKDGN